MQQQKKEKPVRIKKEKFLQLVNSDDYQRKVTIQAKTQIQKAYLSAINHYEMTIGIGPAGSGKSYCAAGTAAKLYLEKKIDKIILIRPNIGAGPTLGFLPGTKDDKSRSWCAPILSILEEFMGKGAVDCAIENGNIEMLPFEHMRGYTFKNCFVILDEAQNADFKSLKMFVTRIGENCKVVIDGDLNQTDIKGSGLADLIQIAERAKLPVPVIEFTINDCVRSGLCKEWLLAFDKFKTVMR